VSELIHARVVDRLQRLYLGHVAQRLDALLSTAARDEPTYLDFLDRLLEEEVASKQRKRVAMGIQIAHFPAVKTLEDFDYVQRRVMWSRTGARRRTASVGFWAPHNVRAPQAT